MQYINKAYLLIGGNEGNRILYLQEAADQLNATCGKVVAVSAVYETAAWGITDQAAFLNQALELHTSFNASELMNHLLYIEEKLGRRRTRKYGPRSIDIDILFFNDEVSRTEQLIIPHPELQNRRFALVPLAEIAGETVHPVLNKTVRQLLTECPDTLPVSKMNVPAGL